MDTELRCPAPLKSYISSPQKLASHHNLSGRFIYPIKLREHFLARAMSSAQVRRSSPRRIHMEPFQIFSIRRRAEVEQQNPTLSNPAVISLLGRMWRMLPPSEKDDYMELAVSVAPPVRPPRRRRPERRRSPDDDQSPTDDQLQNPIEEMIRPGTCPQFSIIPRGSSGTHAASASYQAMFPTSSCSV
jgi:hypothetical protein